MRRKIANSWWNLSEQTPGPLRGGVPRDYHIGWLLDCNWQTAMRRCTIRTSTEGCRQNPADANISASAHIWLQPSCMFPTINEHYSTRFHVNDYLWAHVTKKTIYMTKQNCQAFIIRDHYIRQPNFFTRKIPSSTHLSLTAALRS